MKILLVLAVPWVIGCGSGQSRSEDFSVGDSTGEPSMLLLPSPDVSRDELSERMRFGWTLADESFEIPMPPPPPIAGASELTEWSEGVLGQWLRRKAHTVEGARRELDLAAEESHRQRIIAGAVVGLMYEDVARRLLDIPMPRELQRDTEVAEVFRYILEAHASPYLEHARRAYRACALNADGGAEGMRHWSGFCAGRRSQLPRFQH